MTGRITGMTEHLLQIGAAPDEEESARLRRRSMTALILVILLITPIWIGTYLVLGRPSSAAIPAAYEVVTLASLLVLARTRRYDLFVAVQIALFLVLPITLQWTLGGFQRGSAVALWGFGAPLAALIVWGYRWALIVFIGFAALIAASALAEPALLAAVPALPVPVVAAFWAMNVIAPFTTTFLRLAFFMRERDRLSARSEELLLNILPASVALRLKDGSVTVADRIDEASVLFADIVDFTPFAERTAPERVVELLSNVFSTLDDLAGRHGLEKIKTLGDGYLAVAGLTAASEPHALTSARMALDIGPALRAAVSADWPDLRIRVGIATGPVIAGVIGRKRFSYDLWGDTVNTASRMAALAEPGNVEITEATALALGDAAVTERQVAVEVKGKGLMTAYRLLAITPSARGGR
jgi:class 3 adenylate cyclase